MPKPQSYPSERPELNRTFGGPPVRKISIPCRAPDLHRPFRLVALMPEVLEIYTHYLPADYPQKGRTQGCFRRADGTCPHCEALRPQRWAGFLPVILAGTRERLLLRITPGAAARAPEVMKPEKSLRGQILIAERFGTDPKRGQVRVRLTGTQDQASALPLPWNVVDHLWQLWDAPDRPQPLNTARGAWADVGPEAPAGD